MRTSEFHKVAHKELKKIHTCLTEADSKIEALPGFISQDTVSLTYLGKLDSVKSQLRDYKISEVSVTFKHSAGGVTVHVRKAS